MLGRPASWAPDWKKVIAGSWLIASVCIVVTKHRSSAWLASRGLRYGLVALGLGARVLGPAMFALLAIALLSAVIRASQVAKKERE